MAETPANLLPNPVHLRLPWSVRIWWIGVALLLVAVGWFKSINLLLLLGYVLLAMVAVNAWVAYRSARRLTATRCPSTPVFPGEEVVVASRVTNPSSRSITALVTDRSGWNRAAWFLAPLPGGISTTLKSRWTFPARGRHEIGPLSAEVSYPFGLVHAVRELSGPGEVLVLPAVGRVNLTGFRRWLAYGMASESRTRRPSRRATQGTGDVRGLRPYRTGDSPRDIHWKSSARRNQLLVREYDRGDPVGLILIVDPWLPDGSPTPEAGRRLEWALSLATSIGQAWCNTDDGSDLTLIVPGSPGVVRSGRCTPAFVRQAFAVLADLQGTSAQPKALPTQAVRSSRAARVVVSSRPMSPLADLVRSASHPCLAVDATAPPTWYSQPEEYGP